MFAVFGFILALFCYLFVFTLSLHIMSPIFFFCIIKNLTLSLSHTHTHTQRNPWEHTYRFPLDCGNIESIPENYFQRQLWVNNSVIDLDRTDSSNRVIVGALQWKIYIHPNQGRNNNGFALSVVPLQAYGCDALPPDYKLRYTIGVKVCLPASNNPLNNNLSEVENKLSHEYTREKGRIPTDIKFGGNEKETNKNIENDVYIADFRHEMELLPFSRNDIVKLGAFDDDAEFGIHLLSLKIKIDVRFVKIGTKLRSRYFGVEGAIVMQTEFDLARLQREMEELKLQHEQEIDKLREENNNKENKAQTLFNRVALSQDELTAIRKEHAKERVQMHQANIALQKQIELKVLFCFFFRILAQSVFFTLFCLRFLLYLAFFLYF